MKLVVIVFILSTLSIFSSRGQYLDSSFGKYGIVNMPYDKPIAGSNDAFQSIVQQSDGKIIAVGSNFSALRYDINGNVDSSFGNNGRLRNIITDTTSSSATDVTIQQDGKLVIVGFVDPPGIVKQEFAVVRLKTDGSKDSSFNGTGQKIINIGAGSTYCNGVALQHDGKIVICGASGDSIVLVRLNNDGSLDKSFDQDGIATVSYSVYSNTLTSLIIKPDGKILACGNANNNGIKLLLVQFLANGSLDSNFGTNGAILTTVAGSECFGQDIALQNDGKILTIGRNVQIGGLLARFLPDGSLDNSFGSNGQILISSNSGIVGTEQIEVVQDGKIYVSGHINTGTQEDMYLSRYNFDGTVDSSFAPNGIITAISPQYGERTHRMILQQDGRILLAGYNKEDNSTSKYTLMRYWQFPLNIISFNKKSVTIQLFPNPVKNTLTINSSIQDFNTTYSIRNFLGQQYMKGGLKENQIDVTHLPNGIYFIEIEQHSNKLTTPIKFIKL